MGTGELSAKPDEMLGGNLAMEWYPIQGAVVILLVALGWGRPFGLSTGLAHHLFINKSVTYFFGWKMKRAGITWEKCEEKATNRST